MGLKKTYFICSLLSLLAMAVYAQNPKMNDMWKGDAALKTTEASRGKIFKQGRYAMFIHFGYFSHFANKWNGKTYYGIGEWMMNENMANLTPAQYMPGVKDFNPVNFNADTIAKIAKDAGMKYVVITAKHHDGFSMFRSKANPFNIYDATAFKRDPIKEMATACKKAGIGLGIYYSHFQDWTAPGGGAGWVDSTKGEKAKTFDDYFNEKCLPEVQQLTIEYGPLAVLWFDTPGSIEKKYAQQLANVVHQNQPTAFICGRIGHGLGDYSTLGDMEVPKKNVPGLWESVDVTNDSWGYAWYDNNWKTPKQILTNTLSTVARGGNYMLNVGPSDKGEILPQPKAALISVGNWIKKYPKTVYEGGRSPWGHELPWVDAITNGNTISLLVYNWPSTGKLYLPNLQSEISSIKLLTGKTAIPLSHTKKVNSIEIKIPSVAPEKLVSVIALKTVGAPKASSQLAIDPQQETVMDALFAKTENAQKSDEHWMEKFGEWKHVARISDWKENGKATWEVNVQQAGYYQIALNYTGQGKCVWKIDNGGQMVQNQQSSSAVYHWYPFGWMYFSKAGTYNIVVSLIEGDTKKASLSQVKLVPVVF
ncbi:alpha-L-fucosidase [Pedobacter sp. GSP4]|uniref:alpha-L-fucosidase n=1 Tax=Pedobacter sp. GSP4 TaxID=3453716 RepID=UPI003EEB1BC5